MRTARIAALSALVLLATSFAGTASAQSADDYGVAASGACPRITITLQRGARDGSTGGQVSELQRFLADYFDIDPEEAVTGFFGRITQGYVTKFQKEQGLPAFGIAGSMTRTAIQRVCGSSPSNAPMQVQTQVQTPATVSIVSGSARPSVSIRKSGTTVVTSYRNMPANTILFFVNAVTGERYASQGSVIYTAGSGAVSIPIPAGLSSGSYYIRAVDGTNGNITLAESEGLVLGSAMDQTRSVEITSFTATPSSLSGRGVVLLSWSSNLTSTDISLYGGGCSVEALSADNQAIHVTSGIAPGSSGEAAFVAAITATYTLRCVSGAKDGSPSATRSITVPVTGSMTNPVTISDFSASSYYIASGQPVTFTWSSNLSPNDISVHGGGCAVTANLSNSWQINVSGGLKGASVGSVSYFPPVSGSYTLFCTSSAKDGSPSASRQVQVNVY